MLKKLLIAATGACLAAPALGDHRHYKRHPHHAKHFRPYVHYVPVYRPAYRPVYVAPAPVYVAPPAPVVYYPPAPAAISIRLILPLQAWSSPAAFTRRIVR